MTEKKNHPVLQLDEATLSMIVSSNEFAPLEPVVVGVFSFLKPRTGFVRYETAVPRCKTCDAYQDGACVRGILFFARSFPNPEKPGIPKEPDGYCDAHSELNQ